MKFIGLIVALTISGTINMHAESEGHWQYASGNGNGEFCSATFSSGKNFLSLKGPGGGYQAAMISFISQKIPAPDSTKKIRVSLKQGKEPEQIVEVLNYKEKNLQNNYGVVSFIVPSIELLLNNIEEIQDFEVSIDGKIVSKIRWYDGLVARDRLKECLNQSN